MSGSTIPIKGKTIDHTKAVNRPNFIDIAEGDWATLQRSDYDVAELKGDGIWGHALINGRTVQIWSRNGQLKAVWLLEVEYPGFASLHGEFLFGTAWANDENNSHLAGFQCFDCTSVDDEDIRGLDLEIRREAAAKVIETMGDSRFELIEQVPIDGAEKLWKSKVLGENWEGLVFKRSNGHFGDTWARMKKIATCDYVCMGFNQSDAPKYAGRMIKSIVAGLYVNRKLTRICDVSGMSEAERTDFFDNPDSYIGKVFKATGKRIFDSGALRHPNFIEFHGDKRPEACTLESALSNAFARAGALPGKPKGAQGESEPKSRRGAKVRGTKRESAKRSQTQIRIDSSLAGKSFVFTGRMASSGRKAAQMKVQARGGITPSSLTTSTTYLVVGGLGSDAYSHGDKGTKILRAEKYNVEIIGEQQFLEIIGED